MELGGVQFVIRDIVDDYYLVYDGACSTTTVESQATLFRLVLKNGEWRTSPEVPKAFLTDDDHAWQPAIPAYL